MWRHPRQIRPRQLVPSALVAALVVPLAIAWIEPRSLVIEAAVAGTYAVALLAGSFWVSWREGWRHLPALLVAFAILHLGYGLGFLAGLARQAFKWRDR